MVKFTVLRLQFTHKQPYMQKCCRKEMQTISDFGNSRFKKQNARGKEAVG